MSSCCGLGIDVENMRGAARAVAFREAGHGTVVQQLNPLDGSVDAVAVANSEKGETFILFISRGYPLPSLLLEFFQFLIEVSNGARILILLLVMDPIPLPNGLYERLCDCSKSDWVFEIEPMKDIGSGGWQDGVSMGDRHEHGDVSTGRTVGGHGGVDIWGAEWKRVRRVGVRGRDVIGRCVMGDRDGGVRHVSLGCVCDCDIGREFLT